MKKSVTPQNLLEGAYYAAKQCGLLLCDAVSLYKQKSYSSAVALAAFAREELGRTRILLDFRKQVVKSGKTVTIEDIRRKCKSHVTKQEWAYVSTTLGWGAFNEGLSNLIRAITSLPIGSEEYEKADKELKKIAEGLRKKSPQTRHERRVRALYVEPEESGTGWNKPWEAPAEEAKSFLTSAANDYSLVYRRLESVNICEVTNPELASALEEWKERPDLPAPQWPD